MTATLPLLLSIIKLFYGNVAETLINQRDSLIFAPEIQIKSNFKKVQLWESLIILARSVGTNQQ